MTVTSGEELAGGVAAGVVPASRPRGKPEAREVYNYRTSLNRPLAPGVAEAAGEPMRPAILDKLKQAPTPARGRQQAPAQIELELPLVAPDDREPRSPAPDRGAPVGRGVAVIDFYI